MVLSFGNDGVRYLVKAGGPGCLKQGLHHDRKTDTACGGDALNTAIALSRLGIPVTMAGRVGDDLNGRFVLGPMQEAGNGCFTCGNRPGPCDGIPVLH